MQDLLLQLEEQKPETQFVEADITPVITYIAPMISKKRHWYAVYRALVDCGTIQQDRYLFFAQTVAQYLPNHPFLPIAEAMRRMAVQSFARPVEQWDANNAPIVATRFERYVCIAQTVKKLLSKEQIAYLRHFSFTKIFFLY